jgi:demethylmenaquinone methyltransferase / 2-methoxy-6-polyprenyl-1,4-benzoquinol methylase
LKLRLPAETEPEPERRGTDVAKIYTRLAPVYGFWGALTEKRARQRAFEAAELKAGESVLEVATGTGTFLARLAGVAGVRRVVGIDLAGGMIRRTARLIKSNPAGRAVLAQADARRLPFAEGSIDILFNCYMMDLLPQQDIPQVLGEFRRVLRPSGRWVALVMGCQAPALQSVWMGLYRISPALVGACRPIPLGDFLRRGGWQVVLREIISQYGFRSELFVARPAAGNEAR